MKRKLFVISAILALLFVLSIGVASAESGTWAHISWSFSNGVLTLGNGDEQVNLTATTRKESDYPWHQFRSVITKVECDGIIHWTGAINNMFSNCTNLTACNLNGFDTVSATNMSQMFYNCSKLQTLDVSMMSSYSANVYSGLTGMLYGCSSLREVRFGMSNPFKKGSSGVDLLEQVYVDGVLRYGKWMHVTGSYGPYTPAEFSANYTAEMSGIWQFVPNDIIAYAVYVENDDDGRVLYFIVPDEPVAYAPGRPMTITSVSGGEYTGPVYYVDGVHSTWQGACARTDKVVVVDSFAPQSMASWFINFIYCKSFDLSAIDFSHVTSMYSMFSNCQYLEEIDVADWNSGNVISMQNMFKDSAGTTLDLSGFDVSGVTNMEYMFYGLRVTSLTLNDWDVRNVQNVYGLFRAFQGHLIAPDLHWDSASSTQTYMFAYNSNTTVFDIPRWSFSQPTMDFTYMFYGTPATINAQNWELNGVLSLYRVIRDCMGSVDISGWHSTTVKSTSEMCAHYTGTYIKIANWNMPALENMQEMFGYSSYIETIEGLETWDPASLAHVKNLSYFVSYDRALTAIDVSTWVTPSLENTSHMFHSVSVSSLDLSKFDMSHVTSVDDMFTSCTSLATLNVAGWNLSNAGTLYHLFEGCTALQSIDLSDWVTTGVTNMSRMFVGCASLNSLDLSSFDTSAVTTMDQMFAGCSRLRVLNIGNFDMSNVTTSQYIFNGCDKLCDVTLSGKHVFLNSYDSRLPAVPTEQDGVVYTGKWIRDDLTAGPLSSVELARDYALGLAGRWVWEKSEPDYVIHFVCNMDGYLGSMRDARSLTSEDFMLPFNGFAVLGYNFDHWEDDYGNTWNNKAVIPADTYSPYENDGKVTFTAMFVPADLSVTMNNGSFDFTLKANEKALFVPVPASTSYQVYEQTPFGWNLIKQVGTSGTIEPEVESEALFLNQYDPLKVTVRFAGTKLMDDSAAEADSFSFLLYEDDQLIDITSVQDGGLIAFEPIVYNQAGVHHYYIQEVVGSDTGVEYDLHVEEIVVTVDSDGAGGLTADVAMDESEILFENVSRPGKLLLYKADGTDAESLRDATFMFEVVFTLDNGQPWELASGSITYEERDSALTDLPEAQPLPEKPKYMVTVRHIYVAADGTEDVSNVNEAYCAGEIFTVTKAVEPGYLYGRIIGDNLVQSNGASWKGVMPANDVTVDIYYYARRSVTGSVVWNDQDNWGGIRPSSVTVHLLKDDLSVAYQTITADDGWAFSFDDMPVYENGEPIEYEVMMEDVDDYDIGVEGTTITASHRAYWTYTFHNYDYQTHEPLVMTYLDQTGADIVIKLACDKPYSFEIDSAPAGYNLGAVNVDGTIQYGLFQGTMTKDEELDLYWERGTELPSAGGATLRLDVDHPNTVRISTAPEATVENMPLEGSVYSIYKIGSLSGDLEFEVFDAFASLDVMDRLESGTNTRTLVSDILRIVRQQNMAPVMTLQVAADGSVGATHIDDGLYVMTMTQAAAGLVSYDVIFPMPYYSKEYDGIRYGGIVIGEYYAYNAPTDPPSNSPTPSPTPSPTSSPTPSPSPTAPPTNTTLPPPPPSSGS